MMTKLDRAKFRDIHPTQTRKRSAPHVQSYSLGGGGDIAGMFNIFQSVVIPNDWTASVK